MFKSTELSATLTEIVKIDPTFERESFLKECESDIIPNVLEAITRGDLEILEDWWVNLTLCLTVFLCNNTMITDQVL